MRPYPAEDVDRIIGEEVMRGEGTSKNYEPVARTRITTLLMSRLCAAYNVRAAREAIEAVAAAETKILYFCGTVRHLRVFIGRGYDVLIECLLACDTALGLVLVAHDAWLEHGLGDSQDRLRGNLEDVRREWAKLRSNVQELHRNGKRVSIHSGLFVQIHDALLLGYGSFLTLEENSALNAQLVLAFKRIREHKDLFFADAKPSRPS